MKCLKCMKSIKKMNKRGIFKVNQYLIHIGNWGICEDCLDITVEEAADYVHEYYIANKDRYAKLQKEYKEKLTDSYVANTLADKSSLKGRDIPKEIIKAKRQYMKLNRITKENNGRQNSSK